MLFLDSSFLLLIPALIIAFWAQSKVKSTYNKFSTIKSINGLSGSEVARKLLDYEGLQEIPIEIVQGRLTDHYDPRNKVMRLSNEIFYGNSLAAIGIAAHETGHAIQHKKKYYPLSIRNSIVPVVNLSSRFAFILFFIGIIMRATGLINIGIILFAAVVIFQIITLPVEFNASKRALIILEDRNILYGNEIKGAKKVLDAAAMTYVAAALMAISQLIRLIAISRDR